MTHYNKVKKELQAKPGTWLITGVAGFIGSHLLDTLLRLNQRVIGLDNFSSGSPENLQRVLAPLDMPLQKNFVFHEGDILSASTCQRVMDKVDIILHQAAMASVVQSINEPALVHAVNTQGFLNILIAAKNAGIKRIVYASTCAVYGNANKSPKTETDAIFPLTPYAASKACNEIDAYAFANTYDLETIGLRYFNVFGPHQNPLGPYAAVLPAWLKALQENTVIGINGDGHTSRDFCFVADIVQANILSALTTEQNALNTVYNVGSGIETTLNELAAFLKQAFNRPNFPIQYHPERSGDIRKSCASIEKIQTKLHYQATKLDPSALTPAAMQIPFVQ
ncbi:MAG: NAD-dependent epimerase/dehydratase family protein [Legionellales bacterium]|jgi:UDP-N-acetylglucosamine 4-epimerase